MKIKQQKEQKCVSQKNLKFNGYKRCLEATQIGNKTNQLEKNKLGVESLWENRKEFIKTIN